MSAPKDIHNLQNDSQIENALFSSRHPFATRRHRLRAGEYGLEETVQIEVKSAVDIRGTIAQFRQKQIELDCFRINLRQDQLCIAPRNIAV